MPMNPRLMRPLAAAPSGPSDPYFASVSLLMHMNGADLSQTFTDSSSYARTLTANANAVISTAQSKFGGSSGYFDGSAEVTTPDANELDFGTGDFTVEAWAYLISNGSSAFFGTGGGYGGWFFGHSGGESPPGGIGFGRAGISWDVIDQSSGALPLNQWMHVAVSRSGTDLRAFVDGALVASATSTASFDTVGGPLYIGSHGGFLYFNGYMAEFRVTNGVARYTSAFTPPTEPFPDQ